MSRHRNVRNYAYEEEMYDDVYGHSVEEHDICVSPTTAQQFLYRRGESRQADLSSFMEESLDYDDVDYGDNPDYLEDQREYEVAKLNKEDEVKLLSCLDEFRSILGDHCDENEAKSAIIKHNFDLERAIDDVLNNENQVLSSPSVSRNDKDLHEVSSSLINLVNMKKNMTSCEKSDNSLKNIASIAPVRSTKINNSSKLPSTLTPDNPICSTNIKDSEKSPLSLYLARNKQPQDVLERENKSTEISTPTIISSQNISKQSSSPLNLLMATNKQHEETPNVSKITNLSENSCNKHGLSPLSLLMKGKRTTDDKDVKLQTSPLQQLANEPPSMVKSGLERLNTSVAPITPLSKLLSKNRDSPCQKSTSPSLTSLMETDKRNSSSTPIVHITHDGSSSLSQLLKARNLLSKDTESDKKDLGLMNSRSDHSLISSPPLKGLKSLTLNETKSDLKDATKLSSENLLSKNGDSNIDLCFNKRKSNLTPESSMSSIHMSSKNHLEKREENEEGCLSAEEDEFEDFDSDKAIFDFFQTPSLFACTLFVQYRKPGHQWQPNVENTITQTKESEIIPFDFKTPSPDDIVKEKQKLAWSKKKRTTTGQL